jgi:Zinc finger, C2H2 type/C2H2-type zinc finger/Zinc-finger of C2H2 type
MIAQQRILTSCVSECVIKCEYIQPEENETIKEETELTFETTNEDDENELKNYLTESLLPTETLPVKIKPPRKKRNNPESKIKINKIRTTKQEQKEMEKEVEKLLVDQKKGKGDHFCPLCDKYFTEKRKVKSHIERIHLQKKNYKCDICSYTAFKKYDIYLHYLNIHTPKSEIEHRSMCPDCGLSFQTNSKLNMHINRKHNISKRFGCDQCRHRTTTLNEMRMHVKVHLSKESRESYFCEFCDAVFSSKGSLKNHRDVKHEVNKREFVCFCKKVFKLKSIYQRHFRVVHKGEKPFKCSECSKAFAVKAHLKNHQEAIHTEQVGISCDKCGLVLKNNETLKKHMIHHEEPRFQCPICLKMFHENKKLKDHQSVHTTLEFPCEYCSQSYRLESQLQRHIKKVHIKEKLTFRCEICSSTFTRKSTYRDHALRQHKELTGDEMTEFLKKIRKCLPEEYKI